MIKLLTLVLLVSAVPAYSQINFSANDQGRVPVYNGYYRYGTNGGVYGSTWTDVTIADIAAGNPLKNVKGAGSKTFRPTLPENFLELWGYDIRVAEFTHYATLGVDDNTVFLENPSTEHRDPNTYAEGCGSSRQIAQSKLFKNLYEPIWDGGANGTPVNENNYYALYVYKTVIRYKKYTKFWEIVNEPDQTHGDNGNDAAQWFTKTPAPCDLSNLRAPIYHYIRMLRISYEVIKSVDPQAYIAPGGLGNAAFLDLLLRLTDNPVDGSVNAQYPLKGGAYFDAMSFHGYPQYNISTWSNAINGFVHRRHSDAAVEALINTKKSFDNVLNSRGYNGITYPKKVMICTENNIPRKAFDHIIGGEEVAKNYMIKTAVESQKNDIVQNYMFVVGDAKHEWEATDPFELMGMYKKLDGQGPVNTDGVYKQQYTSAGIAHKTTSDLLLGFRYDAARTAALNLPSTVNGGAFRNASGKYVYVLWARTTIDNSEAASATYTFPSGITSGNVEIEYWDYTITGYSAIISSSNIQLTGSPVFLSEPGTNQVPNQLPIANAGADISITLPVNTVTLNGSGSNDPDGTIVKYEWTKVSGPERIDFVPITITAPGSANTTVLNLIAGTYVYKLRVYDNSSAIREDQVTVTVLPDPTPILPNVPGVPNAGPDQSISAGSTTLNGSASYDPDGPIVKYEWRMVSGPSVAAIVSKENATTQVNNLVQGTYVFALQIWDNLWLPAEDRVTINVGTVTNPPPAPTNQKPVSRAGNDIVLTLPSNSTTLNGTASTDPDGTIIKYEWQRISGPAQFTIANINNANTTLSNLVQGSYIFRLTVWDNKYEPAADDIVVTVNAAAAPPPPTINQPPISNAGADAEITLPVNSATLNGSASRDPDGTIIKYEWKYLSGPVQYTIANTGAVNTTVSNLVQGTYKFRLIIWDNKYEPGFDEVVITVKAAVSTTPPPTTNLPPVTKAGADITIALPVTSTTLNGSATYDPDGTIIKYDWKIISGPSQYAIANVNAVSTTISNLVQGKYIVRLTTWDNKYIPSADEVTITVNAAATAPPVNLPPVTKAGNDQLMVLPENSTSVNGLGSYDIDGTIIRYEWRKESGPASFAISNINSANPVISNLVEGTYVFVLRTWDNLWMPADDKITITVSPSVAIAPGDVIREEIPVIATFKIYPNPVLNALQFNLSSNERGRMQMKIYDVTGKLVKTHAFEKSQTMLRQQVPVSSLHPGLYLVEIISGNRIEAQGRFVKQ